ncbi:MAG: peptidylprolyl isomerase [Oscillospiraceae bacterium]|nr:peptidylprolyl isomerase [Oscillospiraceae bacterium]
MKKLRILGLVSMLVLIFSLGAIIILAAMGIIKIEENPDGSGSEIIFAPIGGENPWEIPDSAKRTAVIKTELGDITVLLSDTGASDAFIALDNDGIYGGASFTTLAKDMFIQVSAKERDFEAEETGFSCIGGAIGFVMDEKAAPGFVIITNDELSGLSESYMKEQGFEEEKIALYEKNGGMPEYEGRVLVFGKVISGTETVRKIAEKESSGYTGGYLAAEPVMIKSIEIIYPTETTE